MPASGRSELEAPERTDIKSRSAATVADNPTNRMIERPFAPSRSLSQPLASTDTAPTPGNIALIPADLLVE